MHAYLLSIITFMLVNLSVLGCGSDNGVFSFRLNDPPSNPSITINTPADGSTLGLTNDCSEAEGLQIPVLADTRLAENTEVTVRVGDSTSISTVVAAGNIDVCIDVPSDAQNIVVTVEASPEGSATVSDTATIATDTMPPDTEVAPVDPTTQVAITGRREGIVSFTWDDVPDNGVPLQSYEIRCARQPLTNEFDWDEASDIQVELQSTPSLSGSHTENVNGFKVGIDYYCLIRGKDVNAALTPLPAVLSTDVTINIPFMTTKITPANALSLTGAAALGDVNGDGIDDFIVGSSNASLNEPKFGEGEAYLFFGTETPAAKLQEDVRFVGPQNIPANFSFNFGIRVKGLGDVTGDNIPDIAISANQYTTDSTAFGRLYIVPGRGQPSDWDSATIDLTTDICTESVCITASDFVATFGFDIASGDFDGDNQNDIFLGNPIQNLFTTPNSAGGLMIIKGGAIPSVAANLEIFRNTDSDVQGFIMDGLENMQGLGTRITSIGDIDNDGFDDMAVVAPGTSDQSQGAAYILRGRSLTNNNSFILEQIQTDELELLGAVGATNSAVRVQSLDIDGDNDLDIIVADFADDEVKVYVNQNGQFSSQVFVTIIDDINESTARDRFGTNIGASNHPTFGLVGDIDADQKADLLISSESTNAGSGSTALFYADSIFSGAINRSQADVVIESDNNSGRQFHFSDFIGDFNNDGHLDFVVVNSNPSQLIGGNYITIYY